MTQATDHHFGGRIGDMALDLLDQSSLITDPARRGPRRRCRLAYAGRTTTFVLTGVRE